MLSKVIQNIVPQYLNSLDNSYTAPEEIGRIHVDEIASRIAAFYEKARNVIDYKEEHLLRKGFINRVLRRRLLLKLDSNLSESVIKEAVRAGHLPNDTVPETKIGELATLINNHKCLLENIPRDIPRKERESLIEWLTQVSVNTIEENLFPPTRENMLAHLMFAVLRDDFLIRGASIEKADIHAQLFIGIQRALLKTDSDQLHYRLLKFIEPEWDSMTPQVCIRIAQNLPQTKRHIDKLTKSRLAPYFFKLANRYNTVFYLIGDLLQNTHSFEGFGELIKDEARLEEELRLVYTTRYKKAKKRFSRMAFLSVISFLISKIAIALAIEVPIETHLTGSFSVMNTLINVSVPPLLMFLIVMFITLPSKRNFAVVLEEIKNALFEDRSKRYAIEIPKRRNFFAEFFVQVIYVGIFLTVFYYVSDILISFGFNLINVAIFIFFMSMVAATGAKIHNRSKDLSLEVRKPRLISFIFDLIAIPFITIGKWILAGLAKFNPLVIMINLIIEAPFQLFIEFLENFRTFIKAKKEEIT